MKGLLLLIMLSLACSEKSKNEEYVSSISSSITACPSDPVAFYKCWHDRKESVPQIIAAQYGKSFEHFSKTEYQTFLDSLDLMNNSDLMIWSLATGVPVIALARDSNFYYFNTHVVKDSAAWDYGKYSVLRSEYNTELRKLVVTDANNKVYDIAQSAHQSITATDSLNSIIFFKNGHDQEISYDLLAPYILSLDSIGYREEIMAALKSLPVQFIKLMRGKGIYFAQESGRSYAVTQPVSNDIYPGYAGFIPGLFMERNSQQQTPLTFIHELCHVVDKTAIHKGYSWFYFSYQYPTMSIFLEERDALFGKADEPVVDNGHGYISEYSKSNAQENFAEHCAAYFTHRDAFKKKATTELAQGHKLLMDKFNFMANVLEIENVPHHKLDAEFIQQMTH